jgi:pimeloyl-ACP methyl ester carboxylesterase
MSSGLDTTKPKKGKRRRWLIITGIAFGMIIVWYLGLGFFPEQEKQVRRQFREAVKRRFPDQAAEVASTYGLYKFQTSTAISRDKAPFTATIILIHGLDDPGKVWMNLAPALTEEGFEVWILRYPNDQPIEASSRFFLDKLRDLKKSGIHKISIVAHSMGGLVSRELLTNPQLSYFDKIRSGVVPEIVELIMVGTPNHGSELARFQLITEFRDQWIQATEGKGHWLKWILDGAGEAKIDLLPGSKFLTELNARPHPEKVKMSVIAGVASPWDTDEIDRFIQSVHDQVSENEGHKRGDLEKLRLSLADSFGDGLVALSSSRLEGIPLRIVRGTHLTMIRNVSESNDRIPPAVPIIIERLKQSYTPSPD